jgi:hypothetical protein
MLRIFVAVCLLSAMAGLGCGGDEVDNAIDFSNLPSTSSTASTASTSEKATDCDDGAEDVVALTDASDAGPTVDDTTDVLGDGSATEEDTTIEQEVSAGPDVSTEDDANESDSGTLEDAGGTEDDVVIVDEEIADIPPCPEVPCGSLEVCVAGACEYTFVLATSYVSDFSFPSDADPDCCYDFDEPKDGENDNMFAELFLTLIFLLPPEGVEAMIAEGIESGTTTVLFDVRDMDDPTNDSEVTIVGYVGVPLTDHATNIAGLGEFEVDPTSFVSVPSTSPLWMGANTPRMKFDGAITDGVLTGWGGSFVATTWLATEESFFVDFELQDCEIESPLVVGANGQGYTMGPGKLGCLLPLSELADAVNVVGPTCSCLGMGDDPLLVVEVTGDTSQLACSDAFKNTDDTCEEGVDHDVCLNIVSSKTLACDGLFLLNPDVAAADSPNGKPDKISFAIEFEAVSAKLTGIAATQ